MDCRNASCGLSRAVAALLVLVWLPVAADESGAADRNPRRGAEIPRFTLQQAVATAVTRNLRMADARLAVSEKEYQRREAFSDFFPTVDLTYTASGFKYMQQGNIAALSGIHDSRWSVRPGLVNPSPDYPYRIDPFRFFTMSATLTQPLYTGGRLLNNYKYARLGVDYSALQYEVDRQDLILEVYEAFYQMAQSQKLLGVAEQSIRALESLRNQSVEFYKAGVVPKVDVLATEGQLAEARIQRTQALTDIQTYQAQLNFLIRYPQDTPTTIVHNLDYQPNDYRKPQIYSIAAANRLEIRQANISVEQAMALVRAAQADLLPAIAAQAQGRRLNDDWNTFDREAGNNWTLQGVLTWTFDVFRRRDTVSERRASQARAFVDRQLLVEKIMEEVTVAYLAIKRSESDIQDNRKAVEFRRENFRI
ncbi:MAG: TolC family protein, partial [Deltaproteobacteria bacterium]|nr:TolC family protein [Deltaproteobacteria bacterium]